MKVTTEVGICLFGKETVRMNVDEAMTFAQLKECIENSYFVDAEMIYLTDEFQNLYSDKMILQDVKFGVDNKIYAFLKILGGKGYRYKKSSSGMRWKWILKRQRRLQRMRRKMRRRAR